MKKLFNIKIALVSLMATALFSSCLKDKSREYHFEDNAPVVDFALAANKGTALQTAALGASTGKINVNFLVTVQSPSPTTAAVTVNASLMTQAQLTALAPTYTLLPASTYTITGGSTNVTIPPGTGQPVVASATVPIIGAVPATLAQGQGVIQFVVDAAAVKTLQTANPTTIYALPLIINSADGLGTIVDQFNKLVYKVTVP
ncbi:DUF1735 domain-containing protein [Mucilaginibacter boryungensis]|uniref:DUF1735 domain-containing protein n=1 Tax=Mucilaginibacter boryungensis TaxID=768480 RepID=A0ABR9XMV3_9SPHI|nr:DUF1735 domain-containing protein [Mucilaginibacter boryungensis]MBE9668706.1 DUF1735 domain-containing protein [Mucilaginibacter boryungensis]